ncbi:hypothetical protein GCM10007275_08710 [Jeotgalicoccus coquinae]|uniref:Uncharacterized protein n=1 Tax=Jeotgalicoccus coquinae TaxID=709509 RepID=A0A6V7RL36_9STAP|nr:hypothetical protein [Jeotgalicoccus coquinae]MBB6422461.1 hypothetical protein [Jeotgalicoccus coquinae]GGE15684.1 hypothetical protein GCM10007275_08710 [Jeotgalicoccus coquinae]CAD2078549.1 hypothetical protein JEOCOQ751_01198 [Jeotgalicoccus coquinae]
MRQILLSIFVLFLIGCNQNEKFSKAEDLSAVAKTHFTASNLIITTSGDTANNTTNTRAVNGNFDTENLMKNNMSDETSESLELLSGRIDETCDDISTVWDDNFVPLYSAYQFDNLEVEYAADEITNLNESYVKLQKEVESISVPDNLSQGEKLRIQEIKDDLLLAISNRTLAVIEFKSMLGSDEVSHQAFMDIHISNSNRYLEEVKTVNAELALQNEALVTAK